MPPLASRIVKRGPQEVITPAQPFAPSGATYSGAEAPLSVPGNPAPNRGLLPQEFMYDFQTQRFNPDSPWFLRGTADVITPVRNLALQAANAAGIKVT